MPYFVILPVWLAAFLVLAVVTVTTRVAPRLAPAYPFAWRVLVWSSIGTWLANLLLLASWLAVARVLGGARPPPSSGGQLAGAVAVLGVFIAGPFIATAAGFVSGAALGLLLAYRARRDPAAPRGARPA